MAVAGQVFPKWWDKSKVNSDFPFNQWTGEGDPDDPAHYLVKPGVNFARPWLATNVGGRAFLWPIGVEGFELQIDPTLGIHRFIGDNAVRVDVMHKGEEHLTLSGNFPGDTAPKVAQALRDIVYADTPILGKVLYVPYLFTYTQRVTVASFRASRDEGARGMDMTYSIEFIRTGVGEQIADPILQQPVTQPTSGTAGATSSRTFVTTSTYNTPRRIAAKLYNDSTKWIKIVNLNSKLFANSGSYAIPDYPLTPGTKIYY